MTDEEKEAEIFRQHLDLITMIAQTRNTILISAPSITSTPIMLQKLCELVAVALNHTYKGLGVKWPKFCKENHAESVKSMFDELLTNNFIENNDDS